MSKLIPISLAVEDELSEWVIRRALQERPSVTYEICSVYKRNGFGYLKKHSPAFNNASRVRPFLLLTDLDRNICPPALISSWLNQPRHKHFLLRIAVREVESWLLGDLQGLSTFLQLKRCPGISDPELLETPKEELLKISLNCASRRIRDALVWRDKNGQLRQGPDYNGLLGNFVCAKWNISKARQCCPSLERLFTALKRLESEY